MYKDEIKKIMEDDNDLCKDCADWGSDFCEECLEEALNSLPEDKRKQLSSIISSFKKSVNR